MTTTPTDNKKCPKCGEWKQNHDDEKCWLRYETENGVSHLVGGGDIFDPENPPLKCQVINVSATPADKGPYKIETERFDGRDIKIIVGPGCDRSHLFMPSGELDAFHRNEAFEYGRASRDSEVDKYRALLAKIGMTIAGWHPRQPGQHLMLNDIEVTLNPAALTQKETKI
jgi:hypothetical protein